MKKIVMIAAAALSLVGPLSVTAATAQRGPESRIERQQRLRDDRRPGRITYGARGNPNNTWRDSLGRTCYRRSDGVRRCEDNRRNGRYTHRR